MRYCKSNIHFFANFNKYVYNLINKSYLTFDINFILILYL